MVGMRMLDRPTGPELDPRFGQVIAAVILVFLGRLTLGMIAGGRPLPALVLGLIEVAAGLFVPMPDRRVARSVADRRRIPGAARVDRAADGRPRALDERNRRWTGWRPRFSAPRAGSVRSACRSPSRCRSCPSPIAR